VAGAVGIRDVTVASGILLVAVMAGLVVTRPGVFGALEDDLGAGAGVGVPGSERTGSEKTGTGRAGSGTGREPGTAPSTATVR
jgi:hypothetical protein